MNDLCVECGRGRVRMCVVFIDGRPLCEDHAIALIGLVEYEAFVESPEGTE